MHVQQVGDDLGVLRMRQRRADHAGFAVVQARHRIEQVGEAGRAVVERGHAVLVGAAGMADLDADACSLKCRTSSRWPWISGATVITRIGARRS